MPALRISVHEVTTEKGDFLCMSAGEFTGVYAPMPASDEDKAAMMKQVLARADYYLSLPPDSELVNGEDISLAEIQASIWANVVDAEPEVKAEQVA